MSAYGHQMEREYEAERLSSRGGSERESNYMMESGFYMTSFAATICIASLATFGVLLVTLLITLAVMLQSCENRRAGVIETPRSGYEYDTCKYFAFHAELNNLEASRIPVICRELATRYIEEGQYARDLNLTVWMVENYLKSVKPQDDGLDVFLLDVDDIPWSNHQYASLTPQRYDKHGCGDCIGFSRYLKHAVIIKIYTKLRAGGWPVILLSRKPDRDRNMAIASLCSAGFRDWSSLIMRFEDEVDMDSFEYFSRRRAALHKQGFRIRGTVSSHFDALTGPSSGGIVFKLPNHIVDNFENQNQTTVAPA